MTNYEIGAITLALGFLALLVYGLAENRRADRKARRDAFHTYWRKR